MGALMKSSWDASGMRKMHASIRRGLPGAREAGLRVVGSVVLKRAVTVAMAGAARDTGRWAGAYARAHNQIAPSPMPVPALRESKLVPKAKAMLERRLARLEIAEKRLDRWITRDEAKPGHNRWPSYRRNVAELKRVRELIVMLQEQLRQVQSPDGAYAAIVFGRKMQSAYRKGSVTRVMTRIYGGDATLLARGDATALRIVNREPHAKIVESRTRIMRGAIGSARSLGGMPVKRATLAALEKNLIVDGLPGRVRRSG